MTQTEMAEAAGLPADDNGRTRVSKLIKEISRLPTWETREEVVNQSQDKRTSKKRGATNYKLVAAFSDMMNGNPISTNLLAGRQDLRTLADESIQIMELTRSMFDDRAPEWWLHRCSLGDIESAIVLAERLVWGFALHDRLPAESSASGPARVSESTFEDDREFATAANTLLEEAVARLPLLQPRHGSNQRRVAIMSRQVLRGYQQDPVLRVRFETLVNKLLAERWTVGLALSRDDGQHPSPRARADYVDLLLSDLNHPGILVPLVDLPPETPDGIYVEDVGHITTIATRADGQQAATMNVTPIPNADSDVPQNSVAVDIALTMLDAKLAERQQAEEELRSPPPDEGPESAVRVDEDPEKGQRAIDRFDGIALDVPSEELCRFSVLETVGKLDAGPLYSISPGPSLSLFPPEVTERQFESWSQALSKDRESALLRHHELKLTRLMKNQAFRRNRRSYIHRHITPIEGLRDFFAGRLGPDDVFDNPLYGNRFLTTSDREQIRDKIIRMLDETISRRHSDRGFFLATPAAADISSLAGLWATITVGAQSGNGQIHLVHRTKADVENNTAVLANLRGVSVTHFGAPNVLMAYLDMLWRRLPTDATDPEQVIEKVRAMEVA